jgi:hypothetical protein
VAVIVASLVAAACATPAPTPSPSSATPSSTPQGSPSQRPPDASLTWTEVALDPGVFAGAIVMRLVAGPGLVVAFGRDMTTLDPVVWTSADGRTWTRRPQPADVFGGGVPDAAAVTPLGVVALGWGPDPAVRRREIWTSPDGAAWTRDPAASGRLGDATLAFAAHGDVVVAAGTDGSRGVLLRSTDLEHWVDLSESPVLDQERGTTVLSTAAGFVALTSGEHLLSTWTSADGERWTAAGSIVDGWAVAAAATPDGIALAGNDNSSGTTTSAMWASPDGAMWLHGNDASDEMLGDFRSTLVAIDGGVVGLAIAPDPPDEGRPAGPTVVASRDLRTWTRVPFPAPDLVVASWRDLAATVDGHLLVLGWDPSGSRIRGWESSFADASAAPGAEPPSSPAPSQSPGSGAGGAGTATQAMTSWRPVDATAVFGDGLDSARMAGLPDRLVATVRRGSRLHAWVSTDHGLHWTEAPDQPAFRGGNIAALERVGGRLLGVGSVDGPGGTTRPATWVTDDGRTWRRSILADHQGAVTAVAAADGVVVAVGAVGRDAEASGMPVSWTSRDGVLWTRGDPIAAPEGSTLSAVVAGGPGWIAGGADNQTAMIWTSSDGATWTPVADRSAFTVVGADFYFQGSITGLAATPHGFAAIGTVAIGGVWAETAGAVFESADGLDWTRLPDDDDVRAAVANAITASDRGTTIVASTRSGPAAWSSADGLQWTSADALDVRAGDRSVQVAMVDVTEDGEGLVAVGTRGQRPTLWFAATAGDLVPDRTQDSADGDRRPRLDVDSGAVRLPPGRTVTVRMGDVLRGGCGSTDPSDIATPVVLDDTSCLPMVTASATDGGRQVLRFELDDGAPFRVLQAGGLMRLRLRYGVVPDGCVPDADPAAQYPFAFEPAASLRFSCAANPQLVGASRP